MTNQPPICDYRKRSADGLLLKLVKPASLFRIFTSVPAFGLALLWASSAWYDKSDIHFWFTTHGQLYDCWLSTHIAGFYIFRPGIFGLGPCIDVAIPFWFVTALLIAPAAHFAARTLITA